MDLRSFHRLTEELGGTCTRPWGQPQAQRSQLVENLFSKIVEFYIKGNVPKEGIAWANSFRLDWFDNESVNAFACHVDRNCRVGLSSGIIGCLWDVFISLAAHPLYLKAERGAVDLSGAQGADWLSAVPKLLEKRHNPVDPKSFQQFEMTASPRLDKVSEMYRYAVEFVIFHEIEHFVGGHLFYSDVTLGAGLAARPVRPPPYDLELFHAFELHADLCAAKRLVGVYAILGVEAKSFAKAWITAIGIVFFAFDPAPGPLWEWALKGHAHPHPHNRFLWIVMTFLRALKVEFSLSEKEIDEYLTDVFMDLVMIEATAKRTGANLLPLSQTVFNDDPGQTDEIERVRRRLIEAFPSLESARSRMLADFSKSI